MINASKNLQGEIQSAEINVKRKIKKPTIDISKSREIVDLHFNEDENSFEEDLNIIQEEEKVINSFEEDIKQIEEDLKLAGYGENIEFFDINKLKGKFVSISKTNHGSRYENKIFLFTLCENF